MIGASLGGLLGFLGVVLFDALRGWRLLRWLRGGSLSTTAPRDSGFWGELAYRIERSLRTLEREAELERTNLTQFFAAMEASPNGVLLLDANDQIEWCNSRAADHFGLDPERDRRQRVTNLIRSPAFVAYLQAGNFEEPIAVRDSRAPGSLQVTIRRYGAGAKLVLSQDLTERERSDAMRRDFVANVSHEIRTPLTVLSGFLETMRNLPLTEVEQKRVLMLMTQQAERMGNLVGDLLTLAQLEGSPRPTGDKWVRIAGLFGQVEAQVRALSAGRHTIVFGDPGEARIAGNESELLSAVGNLANNAVRYTPDGGRIEVGWQRNDNGTGELLVTDTGSRHRPRAPVAPDGALLSGRQQPLARIGRHRPRAGDRQARGAASRRRARRRERARQGRDLPPHLPRGPGARRADGAGGGCRVRGRRRGRRHRPLESAPRELSATRRLADRCRRHRRRCVFAVRERRTARTDRATCGPAAASGSRTPTCPAG